MEVQISPYSRDERAAPVRENEGQLQNPMPARMTVNLQGLPLQWMVLTNDGDFRGVTLEVGSMSWVPLTPLTTICLWHEWPDG